MKAESYNSLPVVVLNEAQMLMVRGGSGDDTIITTKGSQCSNLNCSNCGKCNKCDKCDGCGGTTTKTHMCLALNSIFCS